MRLRVWISGLAMAVTMTGTAGAHDRYEFYGLGDDGGNSFVELLHGRLRVHDLQAQGVALEFPDQDWSFVQESLRHSYEVTVMNTSLRFSSTPTGFVTMNRVDPGGTLLTPGEPLNVFNGAFAVRWIATPGGLSYSYIRVGGTILMDTNATYEIQMRDTTYTIPRWNNTATQFTVFLIQNTTNKASTGNLYFYAGNGTLLHTQVLSIPPYGLQTVNTATLAPLAGQSGSAAIAHLGSYGSLSGKAVALEPSTGFSFDTLLTPIPY